MNSNLPTQLDTLDNILAAEAPLLPSSGFALSVMDSIRAEASEPARNFSPAIHFPWARILPGAILALALLFWFLFRTATLLQANIHTIVQQPALPASIQLSAPLTTIGWLLVALASSLLPSLLIRKLMGRSALL